MLVDFCVEHFQLGQVKNGGQNALSITRWKRESIHFKENSEHERIYFYIIKNISDKNASFAIKYFSG